MCCIVKNSFSYQPLKKNLAIESTLSKSKIGADFIQIFAAVNEIRTESLFNSLIYLSFKKGSTTVSAPKINIFNIKTYFDNRNCKNIIRSNVANAASMKRHSSSLRKSSVIPIFFKI